MAVYLEASGLALNKRMRLNRFMSMIFTERPPIPKGSLTNTNDVIRGLLRKEQERTGEGAESGFRKFLTFLIWLIAVAAIGVAGGVTLWQWLVR